MCAYYGKPLIYEAEMTSRQKNKNGVVGHHGKICQFPLNFCGCFFNGLNQKMARYFFNCFFFHYNLSFLARISSLSNIMKDSTQFHP